MFTFLDELARLFNGRVHVKTTPVDDPLVASSEEADNALRFLPQSLLEHWNSKKPNQNQNQKRQQEQKLNSADRKLLSVMLDEVGTGSQFAHAYLEAPALPVPMSMSMQKRYQGQYLPWFRYLKKIERKSSAEPVKRAF